MLVGHVKLLVDEKFPMIIMNWFQWKRKKNLEWKCRDSSGGWTPLIWKMDEQG
jgi:hypothetical protein